MNTWKCTFFALWCFISVTKASAITSEQLADICEAYESAIVDVQIHYELSIQLEISAEEAPPGMGLYIGPTEHSWAAKRPFEEFVLTSQCGKIAHGADISVLAVKQCYNEGLGKYLSTEEIEGVPRNTGVLTHDKRFVPATEISPLGFTLERFREDPVSGLLRQEGRAILDMTIHDVNGFEAISATFYTLEDKTRAYRRLYFSPDHGYTLVRIEYLRSGNKTDTCVDVLKLQEVADGFWFPVEGRIVSPPLEDPGSDDYAGEVINIYKAKEVLVNTGVPDEFFDFEFPPGTQVQDEITGMTYLVRPTEEQFDRWLENEQALTHLEKKTRIESGIFPEDGGRNDRS